MGNEIINQVFVGTSIFGIIVIIVAIFLAFLPIYFMIGTLTRLTDIKYKLDDILEAMEPEDNLESDNFTSTPVEVEPIIVDIKEDNKSFSTSFKEGFKGLKKPSKSFILIIVTAPIISIVLLMIAYLINR